MNKISIIGLNDIKTELVKEIMDLGVVEISSQDSKLTDPEWINYVKKDGNENEVLNLDMKISNLNEVLTSLLKNTIQGKDLYSVREKLYHLMNLMKQF